MHHDQPAPHFYGPTRPVYHRGPPFPHGGDDFDHGYEVNHVHVPHGKDVSHMISFGKGYVPYDNIRGTFSFDNDKWVLWKRYLRKN